MGVVMQSGRGYPKGPFFQNPGSAFGERIRCEASLAVTPIPPGGVYD